MMTTDLLTFELSANGESLEIHGDPAGLRRLARMLERLASRSSSDHDHLLTPAWGGNELSSESQGEANGDRLMNKVTIYCWVPQP